MAVKAVRAGDHILHYWKGAIRAIGTALSDGVEASRPPELPTNEWITDGYRADAAYRTLETPIKLAEIPAQLRERAGGPFASTGAVNQGYLYPLPDSLLSLRSGPLGSLLENTLQTQQFASQVVGLQVPRETMETVVEEFASALVEANIDYGSRHLELVRRFICSLATKRFLILTGLSGSGNTTSAGVRRVARARPIPGRCRSP